MIIEELCLTVVFVFWVGHSFLSKFFPRWLDGKAVGGMIPPSVGVRRSI